MSDETTITDSDLSQKTYVDRIEVATQKIRDVVHGNIFHPLEDVELISYEEVILEFSAENKFIVHKETAEKVVAAAAPGMQKITSEAELKTLIEKDSERLSAEETTLTALKNHVLNREDKGYFWHNQRTPLALDPLQYLREEPCQQCRGLKRIECVDCHGKGYIHCKECHGRPGTMNCRLCMGKGEKQCIKCQTRGKRDCHKCRAVGTINHVTNVKLLADSNFSYDKENIPEVAITVLERLKDKLITKHHAQIKVKNDIKLKRKYSDDGILGLRYNVELPLGDAVFRVGEEEVPAIIFGYKAALLDVPPFLERYMLAPLNLLREAAQNSGNVSEKIRAAAFQTRLSNEAILGVAMQGAAKTEKRLKHTYSIALEPGFIHNIVKAARGALNKLTIKPQLIGLSLGLIPVFILSLLYVFPMDSGGAGTQTSLRILMDIVFVAVMAFIPYVGAQLMSRQSMIYALGEGIKDKLKLPKLGVQGLWGPIAAVLMFILFAESAYRADSTTAPALYSLFREIIN